VGSWVSFTDPAHLLPWGPLPWARGATGPRRDTRLAVRLRGLLRGSEQPLMEAEDEREPACEHRKVDSKVQGRRLSLGFPGTPESPQSADFGILRKPKEAQGAELRDSQEPKRGPEATRGSPCRVVLSPLRPCYSGRVPECGPSDGIETKASSRERPCPLCNLRVRKNAARAWGFA